LKRYVLDIIFILLILNFDLVILFLSFFNKQLHQIQIALYVLRCLNLASYLVLFKDETVVSSKDDDTAIGK